MRSPDNKHFNGHPKKKNIYIYKISLASIARTMGAAIKGKNAHKGSEFFPLKAVSLIKE